MILTSFSGGQTAAIFGGILLLTLAWCHLKARLWGEKASKEPEKTVAATVVSKEVKSGTHGAGRSKGGCSYVVCFLTEDGSKLELFAYELEFGGLKEGMTGRLTYQGRYFVSFSEK